MKPGSSEWLRKNVRRFPEDMREGVMRAAQRMDNIDKYYQSAMQIVRRYQREREGLLQRVRNMAEGLIKPHGKVLIIPEDCMTEGNIKRIVNYWEDLQEGKDSILILEYHDPKFMPVAHNVSKIQLKREDGRIDDIFPKDTV